MACDCDCQMLKTIKQLVHKNRELEARILKLECTDFINTVANRDMHYEDEECDCGCKNSK